jgi:hypothetical protein
MSISPDKLREQMEQTITTMLPTISEELKSRIKLELNKQFASGLKDEASAVESSLKTLSTKETEALKNIKGEMEDIKKELAAEKADVLKVLSKNVSELGAKLGLDPKLVGIISELPGVRALLGAELKQAIVAIDNLKKLQASGTKDKHQITISAISAIVSIVITAVSVMSVIVGLILQLKG